MDIKTLFNLVVQKSSMLIVHRANRIQADIDDFIVQMRQNLTDDEIFSMIENGETEVVKNSIKSAKNGLDKTMEQTKIVAVQEGTQAKIDEESEDDDLYQWHLGKTDKDRHCPDCAARSGRIETLEDWRLLGLPKSNFSVCGHFCKCSIKKVE